MKVERTTVYTGERWWPGNAARDARLQVIDMGLESDEAGDLRWIVDDDMFGTPINPGDWVLVAEGTDEPEVVSPADFEAGGYRVAEPPGDIPALHWEDGSNA